MRQIKWYGWIPDLPDQRDYVFAAPPAVVKKLPDKVDLRDKCPPVYDQGDLGSCTANAIAGAHQFDQMKQNNLNTKAAKNAKEMISSRPSRSSVQNSSFLPSRLFIYYNERSMEGTPDQDSGGMIRD